MLFETALFFLIIAATGSAKSLFEAISE